MANNTGPKCPSVERLEELIDWAGSLKDATRQDDDQTGVEIRKNFNDTIDEIIEALDWELNMLSNRKEYHKKRQLVQKARMDVAKTLLSADELAEIDRQVERDMAKEIK